MKKKVLIKIDCKIEKEIDYKLMEDFFSKMKTYLKINNNLPEKKITKLTNITNKKI